VNIPPNAISDQRYVDLIKTGFARLNFSQFGEDAVLRPFIDQRRDGFYVDVGCHHPFRYSNTALLSYFYNWSGINIDPDERAINALKAARPSDTCLNLAVGGTPGQASITLFEDGAVNSLDPMMNERHKARFEMREERIVEVRTLAQILDEYLPRDRAIDLLDVDAEGLDQQILESNNWNKYRPEFIIVECHGFNLNEPQANPTFSFLRQRDYSLVSHCFNTSIFRRR
jgi:FkbM family methyltransferase